MGFAAYFFSRINLHKLLFDCLFSQFASDIRAQAKNLIFTQHAALKQTDFAHVSHKHTHTHTAHIYAPFKRNHERTLGLDGLRASSWSFKNMCFSTNEALRSLRPTSHDRRYCKPTSGHVCKNAWWWFDGENKQTHTHI